MAAYVPNDEEIARRLQAEFDEENAISIQQESEDWNLAMSYSKAHAISDSDSDATIEPDETVSNNSPDLFADNEISTFRKHKHKSDSSPKKALTSSKSKNYETDLQKRLSRTHEISDSDSDTERKKRKSESQNKKKRKHNDTESPSPNKKRRSIQDESHNIESPSPNKKRRSIQDESQTFKISPEKGISHNEKRPSLKKVTSEIHAVSESDSDSQETPVKASSSECKTNNTSRKMKPSCKNGEECCNRNRYHLAEFQHPDDNKSRNSKDTRNSANAWERKSGIDIFNENQPLSFYMTKVSGISQQYNQYGAIGIKDILSPSMGKLEASCQFNYMHDVNWLMKQYPEEFRTKPLTLVHGEQRGSLATLLAECAPYSNIVCCQAKLEIMYGTHHTKMMLLLYDGGLRVVIHTSNLIQNDWHQKSQGAWISPVFPKLQADTSSDGKLSGDSTTHFKRDLLQYLAAYRAPKLTIWEKHIRAHDMSSAKVHLIGSIPGRHTGEHKMSWGHLKLRKVLQKHGPESSRVKTWPVIGQFSSIGSLGPTPESWVFKEWLQSLSTTRGMASIGSMAKLNLVFPSVDNIRCSLEGYPGGGCVPYSINTAKKQVYIHQHFRQWRSEGRGRSRAVPHIKTYQRPSPDSTQTAWFLVTSSNLSKAAWGALEKNGTQLMIRSYELGVLFLPQDFDCGESFKVSMDAKEAIDKDETVFPLPYDLPLTPCEKGDRPWMIDVPCVHAPDTHGNMWCPPL